MEIAEQSQRIFGATTFILYLIQTDGCQDQNVGTAIRIATTKAHQEGVRPVHKERKEVTSEARYQMNYVVRYFNLLLKNTYSAKLNLTPRPNLQRSIGYFLKLKLYKMNLFQRLFGKKKPEQKKERQFIQSYGRLRSALS